MEPRLVLCIKNQAALLALVRSSFVFPRIEGKLGEPVLEDHESRRFHYCSRPRKRGMSYIERTDAYPRKIISCLRCTIDLYQILKWLQTLSSDWSGQVLETRLDLESLKDSILRGMYPNVTSSEIGTLAAETAASMATQQRFYSQLAARIWVAQNRKTRSSTYE